jgi:hypothetical protein
VSIVPLDKVAKDPQTLLYHFPSIHPVRYQKLSQEYNLWKHIQTAEKVAQLTGHLLVPRDCIHWKRKANIEDRRIVIQKNVFFVLQESEMTKSEIEKYSRIGGSTDGGTAAQQSV